MPRLNWYGEVAVDHVGSALGARWLADDVAIFQQPVTSDGAVWQMAKRPRHVTGRGTPIGGIVGGCNALAAGSGLWMRRLDGAVPALSGNIDRLPPDGRVGDVDRHGWAVALSEDALTLYLRDDILRRDDVQGETRIMGDYVSWTSRGRVRVLDVRRRTEIDVQQVGEGAAKALAFLGPDYRTVWVLYQTDAMGGLLHPVDDATNGYRFGPSQIGPGTEGIYDPDVLLRDDGSLLIAWAAREGQLPEDIRWHTISALGRDMVPLVPPTVPVEPPVEVPPAVPPREPLAITVDQWTERGHVPMMADVRAHVTGYDGPVVLAMLLDGRDVTSISAPSGHLSHPITEPGEYRLKLRATCGDRIAETGLERVIVALPAITPPLPPLKHGREGITQAADEAAQRLKDRT